MAFELEANDPDVLDAAREDELLRGAPWKRVAVVGDSLAEAELVDPAEGYERITWPERVVRALRRQREGVELLNLGKRDLTSWQVADEQLTPAIEFAPMQPGDVPATYADIDALNRAVGFAPSTPLRDGLARFVAWYRDYYKV
jgi:hypothetical protein